jgi:hypothetical protein
MKSCCIRYKCIQCCLETEMPLSNGDVEQIKRLSILFGCHQTSSNIIYQEEINSRLFHNGLVSALVEEKK